MFELIEAVILSDFLIFIVFALMLAAVTAWALQIREYAGYVLGWLIGIFFIIIWVSIAGETEAASLDPEESEVNLNFLEVILPAFMGLILGFGVLFVVRVYGSGSGIRQGITVTILTTTLVGVLFFLATSGEYAQRLIGIFALAFSIGALATFVLRIGSHTPSQPTSSSAPQSPNDSPTIQEANIQNAPSSRLDSIRGYFNNNNDDNGRP